MLAQFAQPNNFSARGFSLTNIESNASGFRRSQFCLILHDGRLSKTYILVMGKRILCVDDENDWRKVLETTLKEAGYHVALAADATEAMAKADDLRPELLILDLNLAGENGLMLMKFLKANNPDLKVLLYTAIEQDGDAIMSALEQGASSYLRKGPTEHLLQEIERMLE